MKTITLSEKKIIAMKSIEDFIMATGINIAYVNEYNLVLKGVGNSGILPPYIEFEDRYIHYSKRQKTAGFTWGNIALHDNTKIEITDNGERIKIMHTLNGSVVFQLPESTGNMRIIVFI